MPLTLLNSSDSQYLSKACSFPDLASNNALHVNKMEIVCSRVGLASWVLFSPCSWPEQTSTVLCSARTLDTPAYCVQVCILAQHTAFCN